MSDQERVGEILNGTFYPVGAWRTYYPTGKCGCGAHVFEDSEMFPICRGGVWWYQVVCADCAREMCACPDCGNWQHFGWCGERCEACQRPYDGLTEAERDARYGDDVHLMNF